MRRKLYALLLLASAGIAKLPLEQGLHDKMLARQLIDPPLELDMTENIGQMSVAAALGGLRSLVAGITFLQAHSAFEDVNWGEVDTLMKITTRLQPREVDYWDKAAWHMTYNAASYYLRTEPNEIIRNRLYRDYVQRGIDILKEGLRFLPKNKKLLEALATACADRQQNPRAAAEFYLQAYAAGADSRFERFAAYQLAKLDDRASWEKSYEILTRYYDMGMQKKGSTIMELLPQLEERLGIPPDKHRLAMPEDDVEKLRKKFLPRIRR